MRGASSSASSQAADRARRYRTLPLVLAVFIAVCVFLFVYPFWLSEFEATNNAYYLLNVPIALGLALLWGYCGISSFGQVAYFGVAGYVYGIVAGNMIGNVAGPIVGSLCGLAMCALTAAIFGYFVSTAGCRTGSCRFTLVLSLLFETFLGQTAGYQWRVGIVQIGGYNGMTGIPAFQIGQFVVTATASTTTCLSSLWLVI